MRFIYVSYGRDHISTVWLKMLLVIFPPDIFLPKHALLWSVNPHDTWPHAYIPGLCFLHHSCPICIWRLSMSPSLAFVVISRAHPSPDVWGTAHWGQHQDRVPLPHFLFPPGKVALGLMPAAASQPCLLDGHADSMTGNVLFTADITDCSLVFIS